MDKLIEAAPVVRDGDGWFWHPDMPEFEEGQEDELRAWLATQGLELTYSALDGEDDTHPVYIAYFEQGQVDISDWNPEPPAGEGWFTLAIQDSDSGPHWSWARRAPAAT